MLNKINAGQTMVGALLLIAAMWSLSGLDASAKYMMGASIGAPLLVLSLVRYVIHMLLAVAFVVPAKGWRSIRCKHPKAQIVRGISMLAATLSFFTALLYLPQAEATAINFLAPLLVLGLAPWVLREPTYISRWLACATGFLGVLLVVRPGSGLDPIGTAFGLLTAGMMSIQYISTHKVARDDPYTTLIWSGGVGSVILLLGLPFYFSEMLDAFSHLNSFQWLILLGTGFWGCLGHLLQIQAYRQAPASLLAPFLYFQIISAAGLGWIIWGQFPDLLSWIGIIVVCLSGIVIGMVEWRRNLSKQVTNT